METVIFACVYVAYCVVTRANLDNHHVEKKDPSLFRVQNCGLRKAVQRVSRVAAYGSSQFGCPYYCVQGYKLDKLSNVPGSVRGATAMHLTEGAGHLQFP